MKMSRLSEILSHSLSNPSAADDKIVLVKHHGLSRRNGPLRLIERHAHFAVWRILQHCWRRLMAMAYLCRHAAHWRVGVSAGIVQPVNGNPVQVAGNQRA